MLAVLIAVLASLSLADEPAESAAPTKWQRAALLAVKPPLTYNPVHGIYADGPSAARRAAEAMQEVPLPEGRNSAARLPWGNQMATGALTEGDIKFLVQFNSACDWLHEVLEVREGLTLEQQSIVETIPDWPSVRGSEVATKQREIIAAALVGDYEPLKGWTGRNCAPPTPA